MNDNENNENNEQQPQGEQPEQPQAEQAEVCEGCGKVHKPLTLEEAIKEIEEVSFRVLKDNEEVYVNLNDLGNVVKATVDLQFAGNAASPMPQGIIALLDATIAAIATNMGVVLHDEDRHIDPKVKVDTVPQEWLEGR